MTVDPVPTTLPASALAAHSDDAFERPALAASLPDQAIEEVNRLWTVVRAFSNTAHDVNNAMQVIAGNAELLEARDLDPAVRKRVEVIRSEAARVSTTINRLLQYARERGLASQLLDLWPFAEHAISMRLSSANRRRVIVSLERADERPFFAVFETTRTVQLILDLLLAAEDWAVGRRSAKVVMRLERRDQAIVLTVVASGDADEAGQREARRAGSPLTAGAELWTAAYLASAQHGQLSMEDGDSRRTFTLTLPARS